jgi:hypothetical protein
MLNAWSASTARLHQHYDFEANDGAQRVMCQFKNVVVILEPSARRPLSEIQQMCSEGTIY